MDTAKNAVKTNQVWGLIYFSKNYTASLAERIMLKEETDDISITLSEVNVWQDMSSMYGGVQLRNVFKNIFLLKNTLVYHRSIYQ